jgi:hypothetical protein
MGGGFATDSPMRDLQETRTFEVNAAEAPLWSFD